MKKKQIIIYASIILSVLILGFFLGRLSSPDSISNAETHDHDSETAGNDAPTSWTCSMHPQIIQPNEGDCPICGMDLIPLVDDAGLDSGPREMSMSESSMALAEIQTHLVEKRFPNSKVRLVGKLDYDETKEMSLTARFPARIDRLFVNYTGIAVHAGEHLATIYSPDLLTAQKELLTAHKVDPTGSFTHAAMEKLRLWDLLPEQIEAIVASGEASDHFELKAPISGIVVQKYVKEGDYVQTGQSLFKIVDFSQLWLRLEAYESDLTWLKYGQRVQFTVESFPGEIFEGQIAFIDPEVSRTTRTANVRVNVDNTTADLKPGMFAKGIVEVRLASNGEIYAPEFSGKWISPMHPEIIKDGPGSCDVCGMDLVPAETLGYVTNTDKEPPLIVPTSAVLRTGKRAVVYVKKENIDRPTFEGREIEIGPRAEDVFIVKSGLEEGERVVTNGAFKIDSALQIQAKPSMMNPHGGGSGSGHNHDDSHENLSSHNHANTVAIDRDTASMILADYLSMHTALAADDLEAARDVAKQMMNKTGHTGELPDLIHVMLNQSDLESFRKPHFETLSNGLIAAVKESPDVLSDQLYVMHCPMVYGDTGADWLQAGDALLNPYFGSMMLRCGDLKEQLAPPNAQGLSIDVSLAEQILEDYLAMHTALSGDNLEAAKHAANSMMSKMGQQGALPDLIHAMLAKEDLETFRKPHYETLSNAIIKAVKSNPAVFETPLYIMHCPMVYGDTGADWLQSDDDLLNPYFGSMMLRCGDLKEIVGEEDHSGHEH